MIYLGIDPGQSGGVAFIGGLQSFAYAMPETERDVLNLLTPAPGAAYVAVIEAVHSMPGQGVSSSFKFGMGYGGLRMALIAAGIPFQAISPKKWQRALGCLSRGDKNVTKRKAQELFPNLKITHKTADALLLAVYCSRLDWRGIGES